MDLKYNNSFQALLGLCIYNQYLMMISIHSCIPSYEFKCYKQTKKKIKKK